MGKLFVMMGKSATGKDSLYNAVVSRHPELHRVITYTTRPIREGETFGKEYYFVTKEEMYEMRENGKIIECREYDTALGPWFYFTADDGQIDCSKGNYILISTLAGYEKLQGTFGIEHVVPVYIEVDDMERLERAIREEPELSQRIKLIYHNPPPAEYGKDYNEFLCTQVRTQQKKVVEHQCAL